MRTARRILLSLLASSLPASVLAADVLSTDGYSLCATSNDIKVEALDASYDRITRVITFNVAGSSAREQKVLLHLDVTAYGREVYQTDWDPCSGDKRVEQMCPVPAGNFSSRGSQTIPDEYASKIPAIAFNIPDLQGMVKLSVKSADGGEEIACVESSVGNGKTINIPSIGYAAAGVAAAALALGAVGAVAAGGGGGGATPSPTFGEVIGWFQGIAMNGMMSVQYPKVYLAFTTNVAFSCGLVPWGRMQTAIDNFRASTGGNTTHNSYEWLRNNATLVYTKPSNASSVTKRALNSLLLWARDEINTSVNGTETNVGGGGADSTASTDAIPASEKEQHFVQGIQAYAEQLSIPSSSTFMTILLVWAIVVASIIVLILFFKAILEAWGQFGKLSPYFESWRKRYWWRMTKAITNLILMLYGVWTLWCVYQFTSGDSWAATLLAAVTFALFTTLLGWFTFKIISKARQAKKAQGDSALLYENKETWIKYSLFYDNYKKGYWWIFIPTIVYMFAKGCIIAGADGHGMIQVAGQLIVEALMLILLLWSRPYERRSGKWINITIQVVRVLSVICVLVFVQELGLSQTTQTVTGVVLIVVQSAMTGILAILIAVNAIIACVKENPHRRARKEREKMQHDFDALTPLDARNSLLMTDVKHLAYTQQDTSYKAAPIVSAAPFGAPARGRYDPVEHQRRTESPAGHRYHEEDHLVSSAASMGRHEPAYRDHSRDSSSSRPPGLERQPRLPDLDFGPRM
ncbi:hypothetical protein CERZMDRAFT_96360 [Cercospora zeae-maydis SCOH1-5]|uniref:ML-like domain-containing protein n=1 Tax=Cercospora zeae-maydis SCOH1-5 TaxID=717836 RepID=A0A6A6FJC1_9PEZI|nr:hypothetical protein CERZMDRAFT_96360 [Cercospora zeae-maydis SCOH1-5]